MSNLDQQTCVPCTLGAPRLTSDASRALLAQLEDWSIVDDHHIEKEWRFHDFAGALAFVNAVGALAERHGHHPEISFGWGRARVSVWTYKAGGLTESDFTLAAKIDAMVRRGGALA